MSDIRPVREPTERSSEHVCICDDRSPEPFVDRCKYEAEVERLRDALNNLALACHVALDRATDQSIARERVGQRTREAFDLLNERQRS
jgi:hypothetical protein